MVISLKWRQGIFQEPPWRALHFQRHHVMYKSAPQFPILGLQKRRCRNQCAVEKPRGAQPETRPRMKTWNVEMVPDLAELAYRKACTLIDGTFDSGLLPRHF